MRAGLFVFVLCSRVFAQAPQPPAQPANIPDMTIVCEVNGKQITAGEVRAMIAGMPPQYMQIYMQDPAGTLQRLFFIKNLAEEGEKKGLDQISPNKEQLEFQRNSALATIAITDYSNNVSFTRLEEEKYYKDHADQFAQAKVRVIYVAFSSGKVKSDVKVRSEAEAQAKIDEVRKELVAGAEFAKVAKEVSEDKESAEKGGEWGVIKRSGEIPDKETVKAIFALKPGEVSQPVREPNGFYLFTVDSFSKQHFDDVANDIFNEMKAAQVRQHTDDVNKRSAVKVVNSDFFPRPQSGPPFSH